jgi:ubiquinone/menaquinone biosynthesis C-methylase UbiE
MSNASRTTAESFAIGAARYEESIGGATRELARHLVDISPPFNASSHVLDNACGNGIVAQEVLLKQQATGASPPKIACADAAPPMVELARAGLSSNDNITFDVMPGEDLKFPDEQFTHSITNQGILFFKDGAKGACEIHRTLKPGGTAVVTTWKDMGHVRVVRKALKALKPDAPPVRLPISESWSQADYLHETFKNAGFVEVDVHEKTVHYAAKSLKDVCEILSRLPQAFGLQWDSRDDAEFKKQLEIAAENEAVKIQRPVTGGSREQVEDLVGFSLVALVVVAKK